MTLPNDQRPTGDSGATSNRERRVRFLNQIEVRELPAAEENAGPAERRRQTILPGEDEGRVRRATVADKQPVPEPEGPILALDPTLAATRRARVRAEALSRMQLLEDTSMPDDLAAAEAEYDEPEELYNEAGIPIEPFHLRAEREAGYFDAEGNYLEYRLDAEDTDAWLESIMDEHRQVRADPTMLARRQRAAAQGRGAQPASGAGARPAVGTTAAKARRKRSAVAAATGTAAAAAAAADAAAAAEEEDDEDSDDQDGPYDMDILDDTGAVLEEDERAVYQKRVADLLQLGETPLDGLRRLGKLMHGGEAGTTGPSAVPSAPAAPAEPPTAGPAATAAAVRPPEDLGVAGDNRGGGGAPAAADPSTAAAPEGRGCGGGGGVDAGQPAGHTGGGGGLMPAAQLSCGERQRLKKMRRGQLAGPGPEPPPQPYDDKTEGTGGKPAERHQQQQQPEDADTKMVDVASGGATGAVAGPAPKSGLEAQARRPGDAPPSPAARQSVADAAAAAAARRRPAAAALSEEAQEARRQFDQLTSYANLLLSAGLFNVYGSTREQLLRAAQRTLGVDVVRSLTVAGLRPVGQAAPPGRTAPKRAAAAAATAALAVDGAGGAAANEKGAAGKRRRTSTEGTTTEAATADAASGGAPGDTQLPAAGGASAAVDADVDMFGDGDEDGGGGAAAASAAGTTVAPTATPAGAEAQVTLPAATAVAREPDVGEGGAGPGPGSAAAAVTDLGGDAKSTHGSLDGFELDLDSGYLYSSQLGYYYDTSTGLYGDANTGLWYRHVAAGDRSDAGGGGGSGGADGLPVPGLGELGAGARFEVVSAAEQPQEQQQRQG